MHPAAQHAREREQRGRDPRGEARRVHRAAAVEVPVPRPAEAREESVLDEADRAHGRHDQARDVRDHVDAHHRGEAGGEGDDRADEEGEPAQRPLRQEGRERKRRAVDVRRRGGPAGDDDGDQARAAEDRLRDRARIELVQADVQHGRRGRAHHARADPREEMAQVHAEQADPAVGPLLRKAEDGHVVEAQMVDIAAHPGEHRDVDPGEVRTPFGHRTVEHVRLQQRQEVRGPADRGEARLRAEERQRHERAAEEDRDHPRHAEGRKPHHAPEPVGRDEHRHRRQRERERDAGPARRIGVQLHRQPEHLLERRRRNREHRRRPDDRDRAPGEVVHALEPRPHHLPQIGEERHARVHRDRGGDEGVGRRGDQVADHEAEEQFARLHAPGDQQGADHELRGGDVLASVDAEEAPDAGEPARRDGPLLGRDRPRARLDLVLRPHRRRPSGPISPSCRPARPGAAPGAPSRRRRPRGRGSRGRAPCPSRCRSSSCRSRPDPRSRAWSGPCRPLP